jgi:hypothetical protein
MNMPSAMTTNAWMTMRNSVSSAVFATEMRQLMMDPAMLPAQLVHRAGGTPVADAGAKQGGAKRRFGLGGRARPLANVRWSAGSMGREGGPLGCSLSSVGMTTLGLVWVDSHGGGDYRDDNGSIAVRWSKNLTHDKIDSVAPVSIAARED